MKGCSECMQIEAEKWKCPVNAECSVIRNVKSNKCAVKNRKPAICPVKIVAKMKCFEKSSFIDYQNSTKVNVRIPQLLQAI